MALKNLQKEIFQNKKARGFNTEDIGREIVLMTEELGELACGFKNKDKDAMADAVGDLMVYCLGLCEMMGIDSEELLRKIVDNNKTREHTGHL